MTQWRLHRIERLQDSLDANYVHKDALLDWWGNVVLQSLWDACLEQLPPALIRPLLDDFQSRIREADGIVPLSEHGL